MLRVTKNFAISECQQNSFLPFLDIVKSLITMIIEISVIQFGNLLFSDMIIKLTDSLGSGFHGFYF